MSKVLKEYGLAVVATLVALLVRLALDPIFGDDLPYLTFFLSVAVATFYGGLGASLAAVVLGGLASNWFFISPRQSLILGSVAHQIGHVAYFGVALAITAFGHAWRRTRQREGKVSEGLRQEIVERMVADGEIEPLACLNAPPA